MDNSIKTFKGYCKKEFNNNRYNLIVGIFYNCQMIKSKNTVLVTSDGINEIFSLARFYEHFYTEQELRKIKMEKLKNAI